MQNSDRKKEDVVVVSASDNGYAMPLAVTIRSALANLAPDRRMRLYILDGGIDETNKRPLLERAAQLKPPPSGMTVDQILADGSRLWEWYNALDLPPVKSWWRNWRDAFPHARR